MEAVLSVQSIHKRYPGFVLENVSFSLAPNRIMGLIGKNGAGKQPPIFPINSSIRSTMTPGGVKSMKKLKVILPAT